MIISPAALSSSSPCALCILPPPLSSHFCISLPASILTAGLNHPRFCLPCHVWPPLHVCPGLITRRWRELGWHLATALRASDVHDASTDLSLTPQSTDIIKVGHISAPGAINCQVWHEPHHPCHFQIRRGRRQGSFTSLSYFLFFPLSKTYCSLLQIFRPFHVVCILPSPHLVLSGCCRREGPHQHYFLQSFPSQGSHCLPTHSPSNDTPWITLTHMLTYTWKQQNLHPWCKSAHKCKAQHPPWWKIESWSFCLRKLTDKPSEKWNQNVPILGSVWAWAVALWFYNKHMQIKSNQPQAH